MEIYDIPYMDPMGLNFGWKTELYLNCPFQEANLNIYSMMFQPGHPAVANLVQQL